MKLTTSILAVVMVTGAAWGQNPGAVDNTGSSTKSLQQSSPHQAPHQTKTSGTGPVLVAAGVPAQPGKPAPGAPASGVKPATIPGAKPATAAASSQNNTLEKVNVVRTGDDVQIEISSREAVTPKVSKLSSPARLVVELPTTVMATARILCLPTTATGPR